MKNFKKMMAVVITVAMIIGTMSFGGVFAADGDRTPDKKITITGLDAGDTVNLYQVLQWTEGTGWTLASDFTGLSVDNLNTIITKNKLVELTKQDLEIITEFAKNESISPKFSDNVSGKTYEKTVVPGLYLALVAPNPNNTGVVYNPIVVSADYEAANSTNSIDASKAMMGSSSVAKKKVVTVDKTEPKITNDIGDTYHFTIKTTIPLYSDSFVNPFFNVTDQVSKYLQIQSNTINVVSGTTKIVENGVAKSLGVTVNPNNNNFSLNFDSSYIKALTAAQEIFVTYDAKLIISESDAAKLDNATVSKNEVTIKFPNNPKDDDSITVLKDGTRERTFTIDGTLLGKSGWQNSELIKVSRDKDGKPILGEIAHSNGTKHAALDGAEFGLYTSYNTANNEVNTLAVYDANGNIQTDGLYHNTLFTTGKVTSADGGLLYIPGLDAGTYYLKELSAPKGYIRDQNVHTINITVTKKTIDVTEYYTITGKGSKATVTWYETPVAGSKRYTYQVEDVEKYTITIDGAETSYSMELSGPYTSSSTIINYSDAEIGNTPGVELPSTGGIGTTLFYIIGAILVLLAGVLLVTRRRANMEE